MIGRTESANHSSSSPSSPPLSSKQTLPSVVRKPVGGKRIFPGSQQDIAKRSKKETALEREKRRMNEVKKRLLANPYSLTSSLDYMTVQHKTTKTRGQQLAKLVRSKHM